MAKDIGRPGFSNSYPAASGTDAILPWRCDSVYCNGAGQLDVIMETDMGGDGGSGGKVTSFVVTAAFPLIPCRAAIIKGTSTVATMVALKV